MCDEIATPEFQSAYHDYEREMFSTIDRQMPRLLVATIRALGKMLRHEDWRARSAAVESRLYIKRRDGDPLTSPFAICDCIGHSAAAVILRSAMES